MDVLEDSIFGAAKDKGGKLTEREFAQALNRHRKSTKLGQKLQESKMRLDARHIKVIEEDFQVTCRRLAKALLHGKKHIELKDVVALREELQVALWHYEFFQYVALPDEGKGKSAPVADYEISLADFAKSLLIVMPFNKYNQYVDRMETLGELGGKMVTFEQYVAFQLFISDLDDLITHVQAFRYIDKAVFSDLVEKFHAKLAKKGTYGRKYKISSDQVDVLFAVLDLDGNGNLDYDEIIGVLQHRNMLASGKGDDMKDIAANAKNNVLDTAKSLITAIR